MYAGRLLKQKGVSNILSAFEKLEKDFKQTIFAGDIDKYALFTKKELLELASNYASWIEANNFKPDSSHNEALDYINQFEDGVFLVSVIWWETGLT